ncbi:MAG TPA: BON domain-containing protein [Roseiflexaceae bacterium]|nr:BON domain-containing protein [Roseiflexaceae bacterium]
MTKRSRKPARLPNRPSRDPSTDTPLNPPSPSIEEQLRQMAGYRSPDDQGEFPAADEVDDLGQLTSMDVYEGQLEAGTADDLPGELDAENLEMMTELEMRADETDDAMEAIEEGFTYIPPVDPPVIPGGYDNAEVASGLGVSALDEPYDENHHSTFSSADDEMSARVREALRADSVTNQYADRIQIETVGGVVTLRGEVADLVDSDNLLAVAEYVDGVEEVVDELRVRGLE